MDNVPRSNRNEFEGGSGFVPIRPNPYIVGNPVRDRAMFFGREAEFELVRNRFQDSKRGGLLVFCGERRSGKTSILFQILDGRLGSEFIPILIDMQSMAIGSERDFLAKIVEEVLIALGPEAAAQLRVPDLDVPAKQIAEFQKFIEDILRLHPNKKLILLFDEYELFENKIDSGVLGADVLYSLAGLMEKWPFYLIFTGSLHLEERRREYWKVFLGKSLYKEISYLDRADALRLIHEPVAGMVQYEDAAVEAIYRLTAGQPFYTQAVCQNLVDLLNERRTNRATVDFVAAVAEAIVSNPLPQMIFLWDTLERDEKLVLALLAETLADEKSFATPKQVHRTILQREYPLDLSRGKVESTLERLFKPRRLLRKNDATRPPGYCYEMDLWRLWVRRMHSVWQVMREEGLDIRRRHFLTYHTRRRIYAVAGAVTAVAFLLLVVYPFALGSRRGSREAPAPSALPQAGRVTLRATPPDANIWKDGEIIATGLLSEMIGADTDQRYTISLAGYADSTLVMRVASGMETAASVALKPLLGSVRVQTDPAGASVYVDGVHRGISPVTVPGLEVLTRHNVRADMPGYTPRDTSLTVTAGDTLPVTIRMAVPRQDVLVTAEPREAVIRIDAERTCRSGDVVTLAKGDHRFSARRAAFADLDTIVHIDATHRAVSLQLRRLPDGVLVVKGNLPADIFIDGALIRGQTQNATLEHAAPGLHTVRVVMRDGSAVEDTVRVPLGVRVDFDYTVKRIVRQRPIKGS